MSNPCLLSKASLTRCCLSVCMLHPRRPPISSGPVFDDYTPKFSSMVMKNALLTIHSTDIWTFSSCHKCGISAPKPSLQIVRVSRQAYNEAYPIFWKTNTFSFVDPSFIERFIAEVAFNDIDRLRRVQIQVSSHTWPKCGWEMASCASELRNLGRLDFLHILFC